MCPDDVLIPDFSSPLKYSLIQSKYLCIYRLSENDFGEAVGDLMQLSVSLADNAPGIF